MKNGFPTMYNDREFQSQGGGRPGKVRPFRNKKNGKKKEPKKGGNDLRGGKTCADV